MNLIIDIGNSRIKFGLFCEDELIRCGVGYEALLALMDELDNSNYIQFLSASGDIPHALLSQLKNNNRELLFFERSMQLPLIIDYDTPQSLGLDRIANCVGGLCVAKGARELLIIDVGSAITYNYIDGGRRFIGGNISLGVGMRFKALNTFTAHLPLLSAEHHTEKIGRSTETAIAAGVIEGIVHELKGVISHFNTSNPHGQILFTGGGFEEIRAALDDDFQYVKNLGLIGLNAILQLNIVS